eukprot:tig00020960_g16572.t1
MGFTSSLFMATEWNDQVTGFLAVGWDAVRDTTPHEVALFEAVCDQARVPPRRGTESIKALKRRMLARPGVVRFERDWMRFVEDVDGGGPARDENDEAFKRMQNEIQALGFSSCIMQGTEWKGQVTGLVAMGWSRARDPSPHERGLFSAVCDLLGHSARCDFALQFHIGLNSLLTDLEDKNRRLEEEVNGIVSVHWEEPGRPVTPGDVALFDDVCQAAGIALTQAELVQQARAAAKAKSDFLSILGIVGLLLDDSRLFSEQREYLQVAQSSGQALVELVSEVLDASALERGGRLRVAPEPMCLRACIEDVMEVLWPVTGQKNIAMQFIIRRSLQRCIVSDPARIRQVLINLVGNSAKFSEGGRITVEVDAEAGCGIAEADQRRLFEFFTQLDNTKSRRHPGTGLGLFISRGIARALGGDMQLVSTPGCGSTFAFLFRAAPLATGAMKAGPDVDPALRGRTLIAAFDEEVWGVTAVEDAAAWGMRLVKPRTPEGALEARAPAARPRRRARLLIQSNSGQAVRREVEEGRGALLAAVLLFMPGALSADDLPALVERVLGELGRAQGPGDAAPPPLLLLRLALVLDPRCCRENVVSLRLPISEAVLHSTLSDACRRRALPAPTPPPPAPHAPESEPAPAPATSTTAAGAEAPLPSDAPPAKPRILFAEDTPTNAKIVLVQLRRLGYGDVQHAANGAEALRAAREAAAGPRPFRILLSDIMMPEMDGLELARRLRAELPAGRRPFAVALSANAGAHDRQECAQAGYDAFLAVRPVPGPFRILNPPPPPRSLSSSFRFVPQKPVRAKELGECLAAAEQKLASSGLL